MRIHQTEGGIIVPRRMCSPLVLIGVWLLLAGDANSADAPWQTPDMRWNDLSAAIANDDFEDAEKQIGILRMQARKERDAVMQAELVASTKEIAELRKAYEQATKGLDLADLTPAQNAAVGLYYASYRYDWSMALPYLKSGDDAKLAQVARNDLAQPTEFESQWQLANGWIEVIPGDTSPRVRDAFQSRSRYWMEQALRLAPDDHREEVVRKFRQLAPAVDALVVWNTHNSRFRDRGTNRCVISLSSGTKKVWQQAVTMPWNPDGEAYVVVRVPHVKANTVRVDVESWVKLGAGLAEIEVISGGRNVAGINLCEVESVWELEPTYRQQTLVDGNRSGDLGYWISDNSKKTWCAIHLTEPLLGARGQK